MRIQKTRLVSRFAVITGRCRMDAREKHRENCEEAREREREREKTFVRPMKKRLEEERAPVYRAFLLSAAPSGVFVHLHSAVCVPVNPVCANTDAIRSIPWRYEDRRGGMYRRETIIEPRRAGRWSESIDKHRRITIASRADVSRGTQGQCAVNPPRR